jgi:hypothetical protein
MKNNFEIKTITGTIKYLNNIINYEIDYFYFFDLIEIIKQVKINNETIYEIKDFENIKKGILKKYSNRYNKDYLRDLYWKNNRIKSFDIIPPLFNLIKYNTETIKRNNLTRINYDFEIDFLNIKGREFIEVNYYMFSYLSLKDMEKNHLEAIFKEHLYSVIDSIYKDIVEKAGIDFNFNYDLDYINRQKEKIYLSKQLENF